MYLCVNARSISTIETYIQFFENSIIVDLNLKYACWIGTKIKDKCIAVLVFNKVKHINSSSIESKYLISGKFYIAIIPWFNDFTCYNVFGTSGLENGDGRRGRKYGKQGLANKLTACRSRT